MANLVIDSVTLEVDGVALFAEQGEIPDPPATRVFRSAGAWVTASRYVRSAGAWIAI